MQHDDACIGRYVLRARLCQAIWGPQVEGAPLPVPPTWAVADCGPPPIPSSPIASGEATALSPSPKRRRKRKQPPPPPPVVPPISLPPPSACTLRLSAVELASLESLDFKFKKTAKVGRSKESSTFEASPQTLPIVIKAGLYVGGTLLGATRVVANVSTGYVRREALIIDDCSRVLCRAAIDVWVDLQELLHIERTPLATPKRPLTDSPPRQNTAPPIPAVPSSLSFAVPPKMPIPENPLSALGAVLAALQSTLSQLNLESDVVLPPEHRYPLKYAMERVEYAEELYMLARHAHPVEDVQKKQTETTEQDSVIRTLWEAEETAIQERRAALDREEAALLARERAVAKREEHLRRRVPASIYGASVLEQHIGHVNSLQTWQSLCEQNAALTASLIRHIPPKQSIISPRGENSQEDVNRIVASGLSTLALSYDRLREVSDKETHGMKEVAAFVEREASERLLLIQEGARGWKVLKERHEVGQEGMQTASRGIAPLAILLDDVPQSPEAVPVPERKPDSMSNISAPPPPEPATSPLLPTDHDRKVQEVHTPEERLNEPRLPSPCITPVTGLDAMSRASLRSVSSASGYVGLLSQALHEEDVRESKESHHSSPMRKLDILQKALVSDRAGAVLRASGEADDVRRGGEGASPVSVAGVEEAASASGVPEAPTLTLSPSSHAVPATHDLAFDIPQDDEDNFSISTQ